jgi:hypothetical protein
MKSIRIAGAQGFYGDSPMAAIKIVMERGADYLVHDALAELTLSILQKDRQKDPSLGYARDIELLANTCYPAAIMQGMKIVTDAGGLNPYSAAQKVAAGLAKNGVKACKIAVVTGDDLLDKIPAMLEGGETLANLDSQIPYADQNHVIANANVYIGAKSVVEALQAGAQIVIAGRVADPCLFLAVMVYEFGWKLDGDLSQQDLNRLASGITIGHVLECGGQASGGNSYSEWPMDYPVSNLGYPIAEVFEDGTALFSKLESQGGKVSRNTIREQLVYEIHDPSNYITPDVTVDLTQISLVEEKPGLVKLSGIKGKPRPEKLKLSIGQEEGFMSDQFFFFSWPYAYEKAQKFIQAAQEIWSTLPIKIERKEFQLIGINGIHGSAAPLPPKEVLDNLNEIGIRVVVKHSDTRTGKMAFQSIICLGLNGPPGVVGIPGWGKQDRQLLSLWPTLIDRKWVEEKWEIIES